MPRPFSEFVNGTTISAKLADDFEREFGHIPYSLEVADPEKIVEEKDKTPQAVFVRQDCGTHFKVWYEEK